jgi:uncharacterized membrane protein
MINEKISQIKEFFNRSFFKKTYFDKLVIGGIILLGIFWFSVTYQKYQQFAFRSGDTSVAEQAIWNTVHGRFFYQSFVQTETNLREHLNFIQLLYVPLYAIFPHTLTLFFVIQLSFVLGLYFLYFYVKRKINPVAALIAVCLFAFNPLTASQAVGDMHVVSVAAPMFLMLLITYHEKQYRRFLLWVVAMISVSEFVAPTVALVGIVALIDRRNWKWFLPPMAGGIGLYIVAKYYITVGFSSNESIISKFTPAALASIYKMNKRLELVKMVLAPLLWIPLWFSKYALLLIPSLIIALVIIVPGRIAAGSHVFILIVPILVMIFIDLLEKFKSYRIWIYTIAILGILVSLSPWWKYMKIDGSDLTREMNLAVTMVKDGGSLTASGQFGPKVNRREEFFLPSNKQMTDYVILKTSRTQDINGEPQDDGELKPYQKLEESGLYRVVFQEGKVLVYVKKEKISELLHISSEEVNGISDMNLQERWRGL